MSILPGRPEPTPIGDVLKAIFQRLENEQDISREGMEDCWKRLAGETAFRHSKPTDLRRKVLTVRVDSSGWLQELSLQKRRLLKGLQRELGKDRISEIHFKIGEF